MSSQTEDFLRGYYASWAHAKPELVLPHFTETAVFEDLAFAARFEGHAQIESFIQLTFAGAPDFRVEPNDLFVSGDRAGVQWIMSGTHEGDMPGLPATGKRFEVRASSIIQLQDGLISEMIDYWNLDTFRRSVGLL